MPIKPPPTTWHCPKCQWRKTVSPKSDALQAGVEWFDHCPQCGCCEIESLNRARPRRWKESPPA